MKAVTSSAAVSANVPVWMRGKLGNLAVLGGCCGTDHRHVAEICAAWAA